MRVGVGELGEDTVDKGMVPTSCCSGSVLGMESKDKGK
jgi:hypothetical protein